MVWAYIGNRWGTMGAPMLAHLTGYTVFRAKQLLGSLREKGYLDTRGGGGRGRLAERRPTKKANLPRRFSKPKQGAGAHRFGESKRVRKSSAKGAQARSLTHIHESRAAAPKTAGGLDVASQTNGRARTPEELANA